MRKIPVPQIISGCFRGILEFAPEEFVNDDHGPADWPIVDGKCKPMF